MIGLLKLGHRLLLDITHGSDHRTGLDPSGGGTLIALGGCELIRGVMDDGAAPAWSSALGSWWWAASASGGVLSGLTGHPRFDDQLIHS